MTRTVAPELARIALMTAPPFPMRLPTCARGINNRQIGADAFARPPLALKSRPFSPLSDELAPECVVSVVQSFVWSFSSPKKEAQSEKLEFGEYRPKSS